MTDKVQKILSEIATRKLCTMDEHMAFYNDKAKEDYRFLSETEELIKALQQEPVSEKFEKALAEEWKGYNERGAALVDALEDNTQELAFAKGFYRGANWQNEQMMAKAVDAVVKIDAGGYPYVDRTIELYDYDKDIPLAKCGDKVKVLVIKEE